jgi:hypothetical protein
MASPKRNLLDEQEYRTAYYGKARKALEKAIDSWTWRSTIIHNHGGISSAAQHARCGVIASFRRFYHAGKVYRHCPGFCIGRGNIFRIAGLYVDSSLRSITVIC